MAAAILFLTIFSFVLPLFYNTTIFLILILSTIFIVRPKYLLRQDKKYFLLSVFSTLFFTALCIIFVVMHQTNEFSIVRSPIVLLISVCQAFLATIYIKLKLKIIDEVNYLHHAVKLVVLVFVIQSAIQLLAFFNESFHEFVRYFQHESDVQLMIEGYGKLRGLALSSELTFALASGYGLAAIFFSIYVSTIEGRRFSKIIYFLMLLIGSIFAGRTAFIGFLFGYILFIHISISERRRVLSMFALPVIITILAIITLEYPPENLETLLKLAFEFYYSYRDTGVMATESTDILFNSHLSVFNNISFSTIIFGDGLYTNSDGSYYKNTDSGFIRNIFFGGVGVVIFKVISQASFNFGWVFFTRKNGRSKNLFHLNLYAFAYLLILHVKGDALLNLKMCILMIFFVNSMACLSSKGDRPKASSNIRADDKLIDS